MSVSNSILRHLCVLLYTVYVFCFVFDETKVAKQHTSTVAMLVELTYLLTYLQGLHETESGVVSVTEFSGLLAYRSLRLSGYRLTTRCATVGQIYRVAQKK